MFIHLQLTHTNAIHSSVNGQVICDISNWCWTLFPLGPDLDLDWPTAVPEMKSAEIPVLVLARKYSAKSSAVIAAHCRHMEGLQRLSAVI